MSTYYVDARQIKRIINELSQGQVISINALGLSLKARDYVCEAIRNNIIAPDYNQVRATMPTAHVPSVMRGDSLLPNMDYIKL